MHHRDIDTCIRLMQRRGRGKERRKGKEKREEKEEKEREEQGGGEGGRGRRKERSKETCHSGRDVWSSADRHGLETYTQRLGEGGGGGRIFLHDKGLDNHHFSRMCTFSKAPC